MLEIPRAALVVGPAFWDSSAAAVARLLGASARVRLRATELGIWHTLSSKQERLAQQRLKRNANAEGAATK